MAYVEAPVQLTVVGPLVSASHRERVAGFVSRAIEQGTALVCGVSPEQRSTPF
ncbi:aldehyde dehydrogenase family protein [Agrobacterium vitis]|uniref:aldehyde dehydrogenase family protein n=1 Tax=Agrobacterium vitis TaxID=373 RepID=UPI00390890CC